VENAAMLAFAHEDA
jgi:hypothetical protein